MRDSERSIHPAAGMDEDDGATAPPAAKRRKAAPYMSHDLVSEILARLPVESLLRFRCVCKAWHATISRDASFHRANRRFQKPCLLISPLTEYDYHLPEYGSEDEEEGTQVPPPMDRDKLGFYRWEGHGTTASLVHATDLSSDDTTDGAFAHCDGLVLLSADAAVRVVNPATRRTLRLPSSPNARRPEHDQVPYTFGSHQAFGLGHDPRSNTYKVARFFYQSVRARVAGGGYSYSIGMEVFTIGTDRRWRQTATPPLYPALPYRTATFFKGSLVWTIDERYLEDAAPAGFLRFGLEDEAFGVMPPPPCRPSLEYTMSTLFELHQELCLARVGADNKSVELWMCSDVKDPQWDRRYTILVSTFTPDHLYLIAALDGGIFFKKWYYSTVRCDPRTKAFKELIQLADLTYHNPSTGTLGYQRRVFHGFNVIHYVPSLVPI